MTELSPFKLAVLIGFGVALVGGFIALSMFTGSGQETVTVTMWGTAPRDAMISAIAQSVPEEAYVKVEYQERDAGRFDTDLLEALAAGAGPDLVFLPNDKIITHQNKLWTIPFETYSERRFQDTYSGVADVYLAPDGIVGLPFMVDPLVMYWNRSIFAQHRISNPPRTWASFNDSPLRTLIERDGQEISQAMVAMGNFTNVTNAKDILSSLIMQTGSPIVQRRGAGQYRATLTDSEDASATSPAVLAVNFYTQFADLNKPVYTWNNSLPESRSMFLNGDLAVYFGLASEYESMIRQNPNLDFAVALLPQGAERGGQLTGARLHALAIPLQSQKRGAALTAAALLAEGEGARIVADALSLPPVRRDLLSEPQSRAHLSVYYDSVHIARAWLDPEPVRSAEIFRDMIQSIQSGRLRPNEAVMRANRELQNVLGQ
ncbi:MAG: extracellular solute-binding protein [Candidatus Paceibacterota bacterium]